MRSLVLDQGLPRRAVAGLREGGVAAEHVAELGMSRATDREILEYARSTGAVVVTLDSDFAVIIAHLGWSQPSVVHIRLQRMNVRATGDLLMRVLPMVQDDLDQGAIVSVTPRGVRVRRLPLVSPAA